MNVQTIFVTAFTVFGEEDALIHFRQVILVQKITLIPTFTQSSQPVLAYDFARSALDMPILTVVSLQALPALKKSANALFISLFDQLVFVIEEPLDVEL